MKKIFLKIVLFLILGNVGFGDIAQNLGDYYSINKGIWTEKKLRFFVKGNKFVSGMKKVEMKEDTWK